MEAWQLFLAIASFCLSLIVSIVGGAVWISKSISNGNKYLGEQIDGVRTEIDRVRVDFTREIRDIRDSFVMDKNCKERRESCTCAVSYKALNMEVARLGRILDDVRRK